VKATAHKLSPFKRPQILIHAKKENDPPKTKELSDNSDHQILKTFQELEERNLSTVEMVDSLLLSENFKSSSDKKGVA
jgi:hypothetical protein